MIRKKKSNLLDIVEENDKEREKKPVKTAKESKTYKIETFVENGVKGIEGGYYHDLDIVQLGILAEECIRENKELFMPILENELKEEERFFSSKESSQMSSQSIIDKQEQINDLKRKIKWLRQALDEYHRKTRKIIEDYKNCPYTDLDFNNPEFIEKHNLIKRYIETTNEIIPIRITVDMNIKSPCLCIKPPKNFNSIGEGGKYCPVCGLEITVYDTNRTSATPKSSYDDWGNFYLTVLNYQGLQCKPLPLELEQKLDHYFKSQGLPTGEEIRMLPLNEAGRKEGTSRSIMVQALNSCGFQDTSSIQLIMANYWGWALPNLILHTEEIRIRFEQSKPYYQSFKENRKSSLGAQFRLYQILFSMGFDVVPSDFKLVETPDLQREYNDIWRKVAEELKWNWKPL